MLHGCYWNNVQHRLQVNLKIDVCAIKTNWQSGLKCLIKYNKQWNNPFGANTKHKSWNPSHCEGLQSTQENCCIMSCRQKRFKGQLFILIMYVIFISHLSSQHAWSCMMNFKVSYELFPLCTDRIWYPKLGDACLLLSLILKRHDTLIFLAVRHSAIDLGLVTAALNCIKLIYLINWISQGAVDGN